MSNRILDLENKLSQLEGTLQDVYRYSDEIHSMISKNIDESSLVNNVSFKFKGDNKLKSILDVSIDLNRANEDSEVIFLYRESNKDNWIEAETTKTSVLSYSTEIEVNQESKLYEYKVCEIGDESESSEVFYLEESSYGPKPIEYSSSWSDSDFEISVEPQGIEDIHLGIFKISDLYVQVDSSDKVHKIDMGKENNYSLRITDKKMLTSGTKIYLVSKYTNGLVKEEIIATF